jgi:hypothetical protein
MPQVWRENARHIFRDVSAHTALLFGQAAPVDDATAHGFRSRDAANSGHDITSETGA